MVILEEFLGKGLDLSEGCFGKIHSAVSGERGSEAEEDKKDQVWFRQQPEGTACLRKVRKHSEKVQEG